MADLTPKPIYSEWFMAEWRHLLSTVLTIQDLQNLDDEDLAAKNAENPPKSGKIDP